MSWYIIVYLCFPFFMYLASVCELNINKTLDSDHNVSLKTESTYILPVEGRISNPTLVFTINILQHLSY